MGRSTLLKLTVICLISSSVPSRMALARALDAAQAIGLFSRETSSCSTSGYTSCQGFPSNFCCGPQTTCVAFNSGASVVCCPSGQDCTSIAPINCDLSQLNATLFETSPLHSTDLTGPLPSCGSSQCCPKGYSCQNSACVLDSKAKASPSASATAAATVSTATPKPTSASSNTASATTAPTVITTSPSSSASQAAASISPTTNPNAPCNQFPATAVLVGFFPGLIAGILLTILIIVCLGRRQEPNRRSADFGRVTALVSDPIYQDTGATRTDFLRRASKRTSRVRSLFTRSPTVTKSPVSPQSLRTPESRTGPRREPSMESIKIYSPPDGRLGRQTTFTDMMANAGFRKDDPYLGSPGVMDSRARDLTGGIRRT